MHLPSLSRLKKDSSAPSSRRAPPRDVLSTATARMAGSLLAVLVLLALELVLVALVHRSEFLMASELRAAMSRLLPIELVLAAPLSVAGLLLLLLVESDRKAARISLAIAVAAGAAATAVGVSGGRHLQSVPVRAAFVAACALVSAAAAWGLAPRVRALRLRSPALFLLAAACAVAACHAANVFVLPKLYPAFHLSLSVIGLLLGAWLGDAFVALKARSALSAAAGLLVLASGVFTPKAAASLRSWDNVRSIYLAHAPWASWGVLVAARIAPADDDAGRSSPSSLPAASALPARRWLDWTGRDILLISIDALRADHVGAYGYARRTTPSIDALAAQGVVFEHAYCAMPHTSYSVTSLMTGKYMRPLLLQGMGEDSETLAGWMRIYGYRTAAFYPPAVFAIDPERFQWVESRGLDFEYRKVEYAPADKRLEQVQTYLGKLPPSRRLMMWVHLFEPHEPYELHPAHDFGERDLDRYDSEIAAADEVTAGIVEAVRRQRPRTVVIITADHGEEFGEHGGYYHGTTVNEEQVRVPLIVLAEGLRPGRVQQPVQLIDLVPTILRALDVPRSPRLRGADLGALLVGEPMGEGSAFAESDDHTMLAEDRYRLICQRKADACTLFDVVQDPGETKNVAAPQVERFRAMRERMKNLGASHGRYELSGAREEGKALPAALRRGMAGDAEAAAEAASLLDDADVVIRRKAAEVLFNLHQPDTSPALRLALSREEDDVVRRWCALALTRMGQGAPRAMELLRDGEPEWARLAALAFAEAGDNRGEPLLVAWWQSGPIPFERAREVVAAFGRIKSSQAVVPLCKSLSDVRLRPFIAAALAQIGDPYGRIALVSHFPNERYETSRTAMAEALVTLGATRELAPALVRFLGVPDPLPGGLDVAVRAKALEAVGGPDPKSLARLLRAGPEGTSLRVLVPKGGNGKGLRLIARGRSRAPQPAMLQVARLLPEARETRSLPVSSRLDSACQVTLRFSDRWSEEHTTLPGCMGAAPGKLVELALVPSRDLEPASLAVLPLADELPPPAPEPWIPGPEQQDP